MLSQPENVIYFSYVKEDTERIRPLYERLEKKHRVWPEREAFLKGQNDAGSLSRIKKCAVILVFVSKAYCDSSDTVDKLKYGATGGHTIIPIFLEQTALSMTLRFILGNGRSFEMKDPMKAEGIFESLEAIPGIAACIKEKKTPKPADNPSAVQPHLPVSHVPQAKDLIQPTFQALRELTEETQGPVANRLILERIVRNLNIPESIASVKAAQGKKTELSEQASWARTYMKKAGVLINPKTGFWKVAPAYKNEKMLNVEEVLERAGVALSSAEPPKHEASGVRITIRVGNLSESKADALVCAENETMEPIDAGSREVFRKAGEKSIREFCAPLHPAVGDAVVSRGFALSRYIVHAIVPAWSEEQDRVKKQLNGCYKKALFLASENHCRSIAFPLLSSGSSGMPVNDAWEIALMACMAYQHLMDITILVENESIKNSGKQILADLMAGRNPYVGLPGIPIKPVPYLENAPYVFISYSRKNKAEVLEVVSYLVNRGYRVWFDETGIEKGAPDFEAVLEERASHATLFLAFFSDEYVHSEYCFREMEWAKASAAKIIPIYLSSFEMPEEWIDRKYHLINGIEKFKMVTDWAFYLELSTISELKSCRLSS